MLALGGWDRGMLEIQRTKVGYDGGCRQHARGAQGLPPRTVHRLSYRRRAYRSPPWPRWACTRHITETVRSSAQSCMMPHNAQHAGCTARACLHTWPWPRWARPRHPRDRDRDTTTPQVVSKPTHKPTSTLTTCPSPPAPTCNPCPAPSLRFAFIQQSSLLTYSYLRTNSCVLTTA